MPTAAPTARAAEGRPMRPRDVGIGRRAAERDAQQRLPDADLEIGPDQHHPQGLLAGPVQRIEDAPGERRGDVARPRRIRPSASAPSCRRAPRPGRRRRRSRARRGRARSRRGSPRRRARGGSRSACVSPAPPALKSPGVIASWVTKRSCRRPGPGEADLVGRVEHARRVGEQRLGVVERDRLQEGLRREPAPAPEEVVHMGRREADMLGDRFERGLVAPALRDEGDDAPHALVVAGRAVRQLEGGRFDGDVAEGVEHGVCPLIRDLSRKRAPRRHPIPAARRPITRRA